MLTFIRLFFLSLLMVFPSVLYAETSIEGAQKEPIKSINFTDDDLRSSTLFKSCHASVDTEHFNTSYCFQYIQATLTGFSLAVSAYPVADMTSCKGELSDTVKEIQWLLYLPDAIDAKAIARKFVHAVENGAIKAGQKFDLFLLDIDEFSMASVIAEYKPQRTSSVNKSFDDLLTKKSFFPASELYTSCKEAHSEWTLCNAVISGLWVGYALAYDGLSIDDHSSKDNQCPAEKERLVIDFKKRYDRQLACMRADRATNEETAKAYVDGINAKSPIGILSVAAENIHFEMTRAISAGCKHERE